MLLLLLLSLVIFLPSENKRIHNKGSIPSGPTVAVVLTTDLFKVFVLRTILTTE